MILISPYLKVNDRVRQALQELDRFKYDIRLVFRDNQLNPSEQKWLSALSNIRTSFCQNLHAKCYLNETEAIITSMNLYESSQINNYEMGVLVTKEQDPDLYKAIYEEAMILVRDSTDVRITVSEVPKKPMFSENKTLPPVSGFCIRCHTELKLNPMIPYCKDCYTLWKKKQDDTQEERYCHICGKANPSSINKPSCYECYKSNKNKLEFPIVSNK